MHNQWPPRMTAPTLIKSEKHREEVEEEAIE